MPSAADNHNVSSAALRTQFRLTRDSASDAGNVTTTRQPARPIGTCTPMRSTPSRSRRFERFATRSAEASVPTSRAESWFLATTRPARSTTVITPPSGTGVSLNSRGRRSSSSPNPITPAVVPSSSVRGIATTAAGRFKSGPAKTGLTTGWPVLSTSLTTGSAADWLARAVVLATTRPWASTSTMFRTSGSRRTTVAKRCWAASAC